MPVLLTRHSLNCGIFSLLFILSYSGTRKQRSTKGPEKCVRYKGPVGAMFQPS